MSLEEDLKEMKTLLMTADRGTQGEILGYRPMTKADFEGIIARKRDHERVTAVSPELFASLNALFATEPIGVGPSAEDIARARAMRHRTFEPARPRVPKCKKCHHRHKRTKCHARHLKPKR
jgi:hypothetical protein